MSLATKVPLVPAEISEKEKGLILQLIETLPIDSEVRAMLCATLGAADRKQAMAFLVADELTPNQAAEIVGMSRPHLTKFIKNGLLRTSKVGSHYRIAARDLEDFMERRNAAGRDVAVALASNPQAPEVELTGDDMDEIAQL